MTRRVFSGHNLRRRQADTSVVDAVIGALVAERSAICKAMAALQPDRVKLTKRLMSNCEAVAYAKFERDEIIRDTFYR